MHKAQNKPGKQHDATTAETFPVSSEPEPLRSNDKWKRIEEVATNTICYIRKQAGNDEECEKLNEEKNA
jgi:hypothetical protein